MPGYHSWFKLASIDDCEFAVRVGALVAVTSAVCMIVALVVYFAQAAAPNWNAVLFVPALVVVLSTLALLVLRKNRLAAIALLVYLVSSWAVAWWLGRPEGWVFQVTGVLVLAVFLLFGSLAVLATFRWHERYRSTALAVASASASVVRLPQKT